MPMRADGSRCSVIGTSLHVPHAPLKQRASVRVSPTSPPNPSKRHATSLRQAKDLLTGVSASTQIPPSHAHREAFQSTIALNRRNRSCRAHQTSRVELRRYKNTRERDTTAEEPRRGSSCEGASKQAVCERGRGELRKLAGVLPEQVTPSPYPTIGQTCEFRLSSVLSCVRVWGRDVRGCEAAPPLLQLGRFSAREVLAFLARGSILEWEEIKVSLLRDLL